MRSLPVPVLVFATSLFLVGFTIIPTQSHTPSSNDTDLAPVLIACRIPAFGNVERIAWWAWNPHRQTVHLASPEEGWGEIEGNHIIWSSQVEDIPAKAWRQLQGLVPIPSLVTIEPGAIANGSFLADVPSTELEVDPGKTARSSTQEISGSSRTMILRIGCFEAPLDGRPSTLSAYQGLVSRQSLAISNPLTGFAGNVEPTMAKSSMIASDRL